MPEWCEELGEWIELKDYPEWPDCEFCPWFDESKVVNKTEKLYWTDLGDDGPYDYITTEYYFCPYFNTGVNIWHRCPVYKKKKS